MCENLALQEALSKIGRNLMLYQQIEIGLKGLLPVIHPDGGASGIEALMTFKTSISEKSLGQIFGEFKKSITVQAENDFEKDSLEKYLRSVNDDRIELVHFLLKLPDMSLDNESGCQNIITHLDTKLESINCVIGLLKIISRNVVSSLGEAEYDESGLLIKEIKSKFSILLKFEGQENI